VVFEEEELKPGKHTHRTEQKSDHCKSRREDLKESNLD
jgi:hypothetical protein